MISRWSNISIFVLGLCISIRLLAATEYENAAIGCKGVSQSYKIQFQSSLQILNTALENQNGESRRTIINSHIERQIKYLIGISKQYKTIHVSKIAFSAFRGKPVILSEKVQQVQLPNLDSYWGANINLGSDPYVQSIVQQSKKLVNMDIISYRAEAVTTVCASLPLSQVFLYSELNSLFYPADPYLGFWVNNSAERDLRNVKNGTVGVIPNCLSDDFLIYGTAPDYAWYYWQPKHRNSVRICQISNQHLITHLDVKLLEPISLNQQTKLFAPSEAGARQITAVFGQVSRSKEPKVTPFNTLYYDVKNLLASCQAEPQVLQCYSQLENYLVKNEKKMDSGQASLIRFLKFYAAMTKDQKLTADFVTANELLFKIESINRSDGQKVILSVYAGPTGIFDSYKAPTKYWNFILSSLYTADLFLYFGHAGTGKNLALSSILEKAKPNPVLIKKRTNDLNLGIFNCEGYSYYGWDLDSLFEKDNKDHFVNMVASSGVEVSSSFMSAYVENFLKSADVTVQAFIENMSLYVQSDDFLTFQKIKAN